MEGRQRAAWREALARKYPTQEEARAFVDRVGLKPERIPFQPRADLTWFGILDEARKQGANWTDKILALALEDFPDDTALRRVQDGQDIVFSEGPAVVPRGSGGAQLEKLTGTRSSLVPISFLEQGLRCAQAVVRIRTGNTFGSGFLVEGDLLVTNHHVLPTMAECAGAEVEFGYQRGADGQLVAGVIHKCAPDDFFLTSPEDLHDYSVVKLAGSPSTRWAPLALDPIGVHAGDRVNIIQHPEGQEKQLSYFHNIVAYVGGGVVQYLTDTLPGSSGSPVFDKNWRVVALHHSGGWLLEPGTSGTVYRNEGIDINVVREAIDVNRQSARLD